MKRITATEARKQWFRLLDEVAEGEVVLIERDGARLVLKMADPRDSSIPDYQGLIRVPDAEEADEWGWEWDDSPEGLKPRKAKSEP
jgi:antitoxin (DNA-binding transcriptional repressor) of toxin-antitoxin stability system